VKGDCSTNGGRIRVTGVVITSVEYQVRASDMVVNETVSLMLAKAESS
jgi:ribosomal protein S4